MTKKYRVVLPNPYGEAKRVFALVPVFGGTKLAISRLGRETYYFNRNYELTEEQIKQDFEWAWKFAEEVE